MSIATISIAPTPLNTVNVDILTLLHKSQYHLRSIALRKFSKAAKCVPSPHIPKRDM